MKLIVGLGNPGLEYEKTRHNAGFLALDRLAARHAPGEIARARFHGAAIETTLPGESGREKALLLKPTTYMNRSGAAVAEAVRFYKIDPAVDLMVLVDDVALPCGAIRIRAEGSAGGQNGLRDIEQKLGTLAYPRLRIGVDDPGRIPRADYVLGRFTPEQWAAVDPALDRAADAVETWASRGLGAAMNAFNTRADKGRADDDKDADGAP